MRLLPILLLAMWLTGCSEKEAPTVPTFTVEQRDFQIMIPAFGELEAAEATKISAPGRMPQIIAWLAEENQRVKKGQVIARFDSQQLSLDSRKEKLEMDLLDKEMRQKKAEKNKDENNLDSDEALISKEFKFADDYAIDDLRLYSKLEIIDTMANKDYLGAKEHFIDWKQQSIGEQNKSAMDVLKIRKQGHEEKYRQKEQALAQLDVKAPYDGILIYEKNWRGEKPTVGQTIFPGNTIATLPKLDHMQAKLYVLDKDAIGLAKGQHVTLRLEAYPKQTFNANIKGVTGFSRTIQRGNPTKYFEITADIPAKANMMEPGQKVTANIAVSAAKQRLVIPLQCIFNHQGQSFVYIQRAGHFVTQNVTTGEKNLYFVEITQGLQPGDVVALSVPEKS